MSQKYINLSSLFTDIADAIREKKGTNESIIADYFPDEISSIESGGGIINFEQKFIKSQNFVKFWLFSQLLFMVYLFYVYRFN